MNATMIGTPNPSNDGEHTPQTTTALVLVNTGTIVLTETQAAKAQKMLSGLSFAEMPPAAIAQIGFEAEDGLQKTLDGFLAGLDTRKAAALFSLFDRLSKGVDDAKLPELLKKVTEGGKPNWFLAMFQSRKTLELAAAHAYESTVALIQGRTKTLKDVMNGMERDLHTQMSVTVQELTVLNNLKHSYTEQLAEFAVAAAVGQLFLENARQVVEFKRAEVARAHTLTGQHELAEMENKLQLLESRAVALEGVYTRLPADQTVIQQIEMAGVQTLQETATTASARFASIKMTLLALNGAMGVKSLQRLNQSSAQMDHQLAEMRGQLTNEIVTTAANAPGENRLAQAAQIQKIIDDTKTLKQVVEAARTSNIQKFETARQQFLAARNELSNL